MSSILTEGFSYFSIDYFSSLKKSASLEHKKDLEDLKHLEELQEHKDLKIQKVLKELSEEDPNKEAYATLIEYLDKAKNEIIKSRDEYLNLYKREMDRTANYEYVLGKIKLAKIALDMAAKIVKHLIVKSRETSEDANPQIILDNLNRIHESFLDGFRTGEKTLLRIENNDYTKLLLVLNRMEECANFQILSRERAKEFQIMRANEAQIMKIVDEDLRPRETRKEVDTRRKKIEESIIQRERQQKLSQEDQSGTQGHELQFRRSPQQFPVPYHSPSQVPVTHHSPSQFPAPHHAPGQYTVPHHEPAQYTVPHHEPSQFPVPHHSPLQFSKVKHLNPVLMSHPFNPMPSTFHDYPHCARYLPNVQLYPEHQAPAPSAEYYRGYHPHFSGLETRRAHFADHPNRYSPIMIHHARGHIPPAAMAVPMQYVSPNPYF